MRRTLIALVAGVVLALGAAPAPAVAADRLDVLAEMLRERPLAIDPELTWLFDAGEQRRILRATEGSPVPVFTAVVPLLEEDESGGDSDRVAAALHQRLGRPGLYVLIDQRGDLETLAFDVPRSGAQGYTIRGEYPREGERGPEFTPMRLEALIDRVVALRPGTTTEGREPRPLEPYAPTFSRVYRGGDEPASFSGVAVGAGAVFGVLGLLVGGWLRFVERGRRRREAEVVRVEAARRKRREEQALRRTEQQQKRSRRASRPWWKRLS